MGREYQVYVVNWRGSPHKNTLPEGSSRAEAKGDRPRMRTEPSREVTNCHGFQVGLSVGKHLPFLTRTCRSRILPSRMDALPEEKPVLFVTFSPLYQSSS